MLVNVELSASPQRSFLQKRCQIIQDLYLRDDRPWVVAFSGGKDSSATLQLLWQALLHIPKKRRSKRIHVVYVDTGMEHPLQRGQADNALRLLGCEADVLGLPFEATIVRPELRHRYFVCVIGRGYAPPSHFFRWCTKGMRIAPTTSFIRSQLGVSGSLIVVLGLRKSESSARSRVLEKFSSGTPFQGTYGSMRGATAFTPIEDFGTGDVWQFLMQGAGVWRDVNKELAKIYSHASGGECAAHSIGEGMGSSCGGSRFGCWTCTVVRRDKSGSALAELDPRFEALVNFRAWLVEIRNDPTKRWKIRRNRAPGLGPLRLEARREALGRLLETEASCGHKLIDDEEIKEIQRLWNRDGDRRESALKLCRGV